MSSAHRSGASRSPSKRSAACPTGCIRTGRAGSINCCRSPPLGQRPLCCPGRPCRHLRHSAARQCGQGSARRRRRRPAGRPRADLRLEQPGLDPQFLGLRPDRRRAPPSATLVEQDELAYALNLCAAGDRVGGRRAAAGSAPAGARPLGGGRRMPPPHPSRRRPRRTRTRRGDHLHVRHRGASQGRRARAHRSLLANQQMLLHVTRRLPYQPDRSRRRGLPAHRPAVPYRRHRRPAARCHWSATHWSFPADASIPARRWN